VALGWTCKGMYVSESVWCYEAGRFLVVTGANGIWTAPNLLLLRLYLVIILLYSGAQLYMRLPKGSCVVVRSFPSPLYRVVTEDAASSGWRWLSSGRGWGSVERFSCGIISWLLILRYSVAQGTFTALWLRGRRTYAHRRQWRHRPRAELKLWTV